MLIDCVCIARLMIVYRRTLFSSFRLKALKPKPHTCGSCDCGMQGWTYALECCWIVSCRVWLGIWCDYSSFEISGNPTLIIQRLDSTLCSNKTQASEPPEQLHHKLRNPRRTWTLDIGFGVQGFGCGNSTILYFKCLKTALKSLIYHLTSQQDPTLGFIGFRVLVSDLG